MKNLDLTESFIPFDERTEYQKKVAAESRKRVQAYSMIDFFMSAVSYFDFFSRDMFDLVQQAKILAFELEDDVVCLDHFLYLLVSPRKVEPLELTAILNSYCINIKSVCRAFKSFDDSKNSPLTLSTDKNFFSPKKAILSKYYQFIEFINSSELSDYFLENLFDFENDINDDEIDFSSEVWQLFEKSAENAGYRFKTAVITPEIFFITLMEEKKKKIGKVIRSFVPDEIDWLVLRFKLIKRAYYHESLIRQKVNRKYLSFTYLYKRTIPEISFDQFLTKDDRRLEEIVVTFRNNLIADLLPYEFNDYLQTDVEYTLSSVRKSGSQRRYSF